MWVQQEVEHWLSERSCRSLLIVLTGGELTWDDSSHDFDWDRTDALPPCLRGKFAGEPLWVDFRWARQEQSLTLKHERFRDSVATVAAELHGMSKRDLGVLVASYFALQQRRQAEQRRTIALAERLASDSIRVVDDQARLIELSVLLAVESVRHHPLFENDAAIRRALRLYPKAVPYKASGISAIAFSADSQMAALAGQGNGIDVIELPGGRVRLRLPQPANVLSLTLSPAGDLAAAGSDGIVRLFNVSNGNKIGELKGARNVVAMAFSPDGSELAIGEDKFVEMFETRAWTPMPRLDCQEAVKELGFRGSDQLLVTGDAGVVLFSNRKGVWARTEGLTPAGEVAFSADGQYQVSCSHMASIEKNCLVSNVSTGREFSTLVHQDLVRAVVFSLDSRYVATTSRDQAVRIFETATGKPVAYLAAEGSGSLLFSPDSRYCATGNGQHVRLYQLASETVVRSRPGGRLISAAFSSDGRYVAHGGMAEVFEVATGVRVLALERGLAGRTVALSADGRFLAVDGRVLEVNGPIEVYPGGRPGVLGLAFNSDARFLAVGTLGMVQLRDVPARKQVFERQIPQLRCVSLRQC